MRGRGSEGRGGWREEGDGEREWRFLWFGHIPLANTHWGLGNKAQLRIQEKEKGCDGQVIASHLNGGVPRCQKLSLSLN